ncbi:MAG: dTMP kinase [Planctomycetota bacterium]
MVLACGQDVGDLRRMRPACIVPAMFDLCDALRGRFIVFDGPDGSGKTTQFHRFAEACRAHTLDVCEVREPGGTHIGEQIRNILLDPGNEDMSLRCEMMLYMASRAQLIEQMIRPALERGELVLADRFISSTLAYQGTAGGMSQEEILAVGRVAIGNIWPELTVVFDVDSSTAARRLNPLLDRMEQKGEAFHARVRQGYLAQAQATPDEYLVIDASPCEDDVSAALITGLKARLGV